MVALGCRRRDADVAGPAARGETAGDPQQQAEEEEQHAPDVHGG